MKWIDNPAKLKIICSLALLMSGVASLITYVFQFHTLIAKIRCNHELSTLIDADTDVFYFKLFMSKHSKNHSGDQYHHRLKIFRENLRVIEKLNSEADGMTQYGLSPFADMTEREFQEKMLMGRDTFNKPCSHLEQPCSFNASTPGKGRAARTPYVPSRFDWRDNGSVVGPVINQEACAACWAFSVVGVMESMAVISKEMQYTRLSIQELMDCSTDYCSQCAGGDPAAALKYLCIRRKRLTTEAVYGLQLKNQSCYMDSVPASSTKVGLKSFVNKCDMDPDEIAMVISTHGPVVAVVNSNNWLYYTGGVIWTHCMGNWPQINHVVQLVGYNKSPEGEIPYFLARNSWGDEWGEDGYVRIAMYGDQVCALGKQISYLDVYKAQ